MIKNKKTYTIIFGVALVAVIALLYSGIGVEEGVEFTFGRGAMIFLVAAVGFGFIVHLVFELESRESRKIKLSEFDTAEEAEEHINKLQKHIQYQEKNNADLQKTKERFKYEAFHDSLTKLPNRKKFLEKMGQWLRKSQTEAKFGFTVLSLDLNRFKTINESLGHTLGDTLILKVAERLSNSVRQRDLVARFGGDEFGILLDDVTKTEDVEACVEMICKNLKEPFHIGSRDIFTSVSVGIALSHPGYEKAEDLLRDGDIAMYHAKSNETEYVVFDASMHTRAVTLLQVETDLRHAIERDEFVTYYQPIVCLKTMKLMGFESLIRWNHPTRGLVPPGDFIPVTEVTNLIIPITLWILRKSCTQLVEWKQKYPNHEQLMISVNLSGKHFAQHDLVSQVKTILHETGMDPKFLKLELTESAIMDNADTAIFMLKRLRDLGIQISIDDFGTGYSSLSYLQRFPINTLKVDRSFVSSMEDGSENGEIVSTILALAKVLKLDVIAEGIETVHQLHQLRVLNCEFGQGFLFSKPVSAPKAEELIRDTSEWRNILPSVEANGESVSNSPNSPMAKPATNMPDANPVGKVVPASNSGRKPNVPADVSKAGQPMRQPNQQRRLNRPPEANKGMPAAAQPVRAVPNQTSRDVQQHKAPKPVQGRPGQPGLNNPETSAPKPVPERPTQPAQGRPNFRQGMPVRTNRTAANNAAKPINPESVQGQSNVGQGAPVRPSPPPTNVIRPKPSVAEPIRSRPKVKTENHNRPMNSDASLVDRNDF